MSEHLATIAWSCGDQDFTDNRYSRAHVWRFATAAQEAYGKGAINPA